MSIIYSNANGWIISHAKFFEKIPVQLQRPFEQAQRECGPSDNNENACEYFKLYPKLFDIWVPYKNSKIKGQCRRQHEPEDVNAADNNGDPVIAKDPNYTTVHIVERLSRPLIQAAKAKRLAFVQSRTETEECDDHGQAQDNVTPNDNSSAIQIAQDFYRQIESKDAENSSSWSGPEFYGENTLDTGVKTEFNGQPIIIPPQTWFHCRDVKSIGSRLEEQKFDVIVIDPPWRNKYIRRRKRKQAQAGYELLENCKIEEICIDRLTNDNALVLVWCTNCKAHQEQVVGKFFPKWQLQYIQKWYWLKVTQMGVPVSEFHEPDSTLKQPFETILIGRKRNSSMGSGSLSSSITIAEDIESNCKIIVSVPSSLHSHKPPLVEVIESQFGINTRQLRCLEIFARSLVPGWTSYGNQVLLLQAEQLYARHTRHKQNDHDEN